MSRAALETFVSMDEFYSAVVARRRSPETDFGVLWLAEGRSFPTWRISYVDLTGELYAVQGTATVTIVGAPVEVIGRFPLRPCATCTGKGGHTTACPACSGTGYSRQAVEAALAGWADVCGMPGSLEWARRRAAGERVPVPHPVRSFEEELLG